MPTLAEQYLSGDTSNIKSEPVEQGSLTDKYLSLTPAEIAAERVRKGVYGHKGNTLSDIVAGGKQGVSDVANTVGKGIGFFDQLINSNAKVNLDTGQVEISGPGAERKKAFEKRVEEENKIAAENQSTGFAIGRVGGQVAATTPFMPTRALNLIDKAQGALPTITAAGQKIAAPIANRLGAAVNKGAIVGGEFGALTSAANDKSLGQNVLEGTIAGAVGGPLFELAGIAGKGTASKLKEWYDISKASGDLSPVAVKNTLQVLHDAGYTPQQVKAELKRLGPDATLADLDPAFLAEAEALSKSGGTATSIMKNRYSARADQADNAAMHMFEQKLGGVPDLDIVKQRIIQDAQNAVKGDYQTAHNSTHNLDIQPVIDTIDEQLKSAVGGKSKLLRTVKSYLYRTEQDAQGNNINVLKYNIKDLHEVRQGLDDLIDKAKTPTTSSGKNALRAIQDVRSQIDTELKTNNEMAAADEKFAEKMQIAKGLDIGKEAFNDKTNYNQFYRIYSQASPEVQETIRQGARAAIGDMMAKSGQGELSSAQKLFEKKSLNRDKFTLMFGKDAEDVLDAIHNQLSFRRTERTIEGGSRTAQNEAIQARYGIRPAGNETVLGEATKGAMFDVLAGTPAIATTINTGKRLLSGGYTKYTENRLGSKIAGTADILSRQGVERDNAVNILDRVQRVREKKNLPSPESLLRLPVTLPVALTKQYNETRE